MVTLISAARLGKHELPAQSTVLTECIFTIQKLDDRFLPIIRWLLILYKVVLGDILA